MPTSGEPSTAPRLILSSWFVTNCKNVINRKIVIFAPWSGSHSTSPEEVKKNKESESDELNQLSYSGP